MIQTFSPINTQTAHQFIQQLEGDPKVVELFNFGRSIKNSIVWGMRLSSPFWEIPQFAYLASKEIFRLFTPQPRPTEDKVPISPESLERFTPHLDEKKAKQIKNNLYAVFTLKERLLRGKELSFFYCPSGHSTAVSLHGHVFFNKDFAGQTPKEAEFTFAHEFSHFICKDVLKKMALKSLCIALPVIAFFKHSFLAYYLTYVLLFEVRQMYSRYCEARADLSAMQILNSNEGATIFCNKEVCRKALEVFLQLPNSYFLSYQKLGEAEKRDVLEYLYRNNLVADDLTHPDSWERLKMAESFNSSNL